VTNLIYSLSHFLRYSGNETFSDPSFHSSFHLYLEILKPFTLPAQIWPGAVGLFLFGMVLSYSYLRTENLIFPIGLHAGAVFFMKLDRWFIQVNSETHKIIFGGADFHASLLGWLFILIMGVGVRCLLKNEREGA
jgi:membrane protease YdiL (CAAX protease family)